MDAVSVILSKYIFKLDHACLHNFVLFLSGPLKPGNTDSVSQNFKKYSMATRAKIEFTRSDLYLLTISVGVCVDRGMIERHGCISLNKLTKLAEKVRLFYALDLKDN